MRGGCSLLLRTNVRCIGQLHQTLVFELLLNILAPDTTTISRARDLGLVALAIVLETTGAFAIAA
jgi:hypothetical protein